LFGGAASRLVVPGSRVVPIPDALEERAVLLALAATAYHALTSGPASEAAPDLIIGHGVLGRLAARLTLALGYPAPAVWEADPSRRTDARGYTAMAPDPESGNRYDTILDVSGAADLLDTLIEQLAPGGEIILAGFYSQPLQFTFPPAFLREARIRVAAEWRVADLAKVTELAASGSLDLDGLITHRHPANEAHDAYRTAFSDVHCLKMILDWSEVV
jgi:3-hydroxyethyl bacteriochlorophyllide a dehydrogenase